MRDHQEDHRDGEQRGQPQECVQVIGALRGVPRSLHDDAGHQRVDGEIDQTDDAAEKQMTPHIGNYHPV